MPKCELDTAETSHSPYKDFYVGIYASATVVSRNEPPNSPADGQLIRRMRWERKFWTSERPGSITAEWIGGLATFVFFDRAYLFNLDFFEHLPQAIAGAQPRGVPNCPLSSAMFDNASLDTEFERSMHL